MSFWDDKDEMADETNGFEVEPDKADTEELSSAPNEFADDFGERIDGDVATMNSPYENNDSKNKNKNRSLYEQMPTDAQGQDIDPNADNAQTTMTEGDDENASATDSEDDEPLTR